jgi:hypothetical protein
MAAASGEYSRPANYVLRICFISQPFEKRKGCLIRWQRISNLYGVRLKKKGLLNQIAN